MGIETTKMSSKGQVVVPQDIREELGVEEGDIFAIFGSHDTIVLKKIETPSRESLIKDFKEIAVEGKKRLKKLGIREKDIPGIVHKSRGVKD
jgi:AbrB family looped-hinge helix DNA binding protein